MSWGMYRPSLVAAGAWWDLCLGVKLGITHRMQACLAHHGEHHRVLSSEEHLQDRLHIVDMYAVACCCTLGSDDFARSRVTIAALNPTQR